MLVVRCCYQRRLVSHIQGVIQENNIGCQDLIECQFPTIPTLLCNWTVLPSGLGNTLVSTPALTGNHVSQSALIKFESECTTCKHTAGQVGTNVNKNLVLLFKCHRISHNRPSVAERGAEWAPLGYHVTID
ncbi:hypothetical protein RRG08_030188 [Elysia crispata]|uniref:Uncharacterized protein n=1 Tax=Elysia crispata TaxID=231223 RepID=A0AAE1DKL5_9GAST|nr:hypothetical protein RRG08_030188 [Elysia crispata]